MKGEDMKLYDFEDVLNENFGPVGTPKRDEFERSVDEAVHAYNLGEAIKKARVSKNLTQEELGEKIGVHKSRISRMERGRNVSLSGITRVFHAMGIPLTLEMGDIGKVALY